MLQRRMTEVPQTGVVNLADRRRHCAGSNDREI